MCENMEHTVVSQPKTTSRPLGFSEMLNLSFCNQSPELTCPGNKQYPRMLFVLQERVQQRKRCREKTAWSCFSDISVQQQELRCLRGETRQQQRRKTSGWTRRLRQEICCYYYKKGISRTGKEWNMKQLSYQIWDTADDYLTFKCRIYSWNRFKQHSKA